MKKLKSVVICVFVALLVAGASSSALSGQTITVTSATPSSAAQGTISLDVVISGSGFKNGAKSQWFVSGTTNPGGVTVNSTTFNGSNRLTANITISDAALVSGFDIVVTNADGRTGKGTEKFAVTTKGSNSCSTSDTPSGFTLVSLLNSVAPNGAATITTLNLGNAIRIRPLDLDRNGVVDTLVAFVTSGTSSGGSQGTYAFLLDPVTGQPQTLNPVTGASWQNPLLLLTGVRATSAAAGDVNGDGIPDFVMAIPSDGVAYLFVGSVNSSTFNPSFTPYRIPPASGVSAWGQSIALGDLDGDGNDEVVVGAMAGSKKGPTIAAVYAFKYASGSLSLSQTIQDPPGTGEGFGAAVAIGNVDGLAGNELVVGAPGAGKVYVFPYPAQQSTFFTLTGPGPNFGRGLGIADVNLDGFPDLVVVTGDQFNGSDTTAQALLFSGTIHSGATYTNQLLPASGLAYSWGAPNIDIGDMLTNGAVLVGTPNAGCSGAAHLFTSPFNSTQTPNYVFEPPTVQQPFNYGYGVGVAPGYPFIVIGDKLHNVGTTTQAGQVYVYKKN